MSLEVRLILMVILIVGLVIYRTGFFAKLKEKREKQAAEAEEKRKREEKRARLQEAKKREEQQRQQALELLKRAAPGLGHRTAMVAGQEVWYFEGGAKNDRPTVLLLHGFAGDKENWAPVATRLARQGWHVVAPDLPGFGQNVKDDSQSYDVTTQAKRIRAFAHKLGLKQLHLVGSSLGATIAATYAYASPEEISSLTLIEPFGVHVPYQSELDEMLAKDVNPLVIANPQAFSNLQSFLHLNPPEMPPALVKYKADNAAQNRVFYLKVWKQTREGDRANLLDLILPHLKLRAMVLMGAKSRVVHGATADVIRAMMPNSALTAVVENCGHLPMVERPEETEQHISRFLTAVSGAPSAPSTPPSAPSAPPSTPSTTA